jgi:hypothetical protein
MPVTQCGQNTTVLTGQDGMITMKPPGTQACLLDFTDFPAPVAPATTSLLKIPANSDFRVNDPVVFTEKGTANLDSELTAGTVYYIKTRPSSTTCTISATLGGAALAFNGDGGAGSADTPGAGNHIEMSFASAFAMCEVPNITLTVTRGEIDTTSIPCKPGAGASGPKLAQFRRYQSGFADGNGTLTLRLIEDLAAFNNRIIQGTLFNDQSGAVLKAYFNAVANTGNPATVDDTTSLYSEFPVILLGFDTGISQDESPTEVSVNFRVSGQPAHLFGLTY